jgi:hypothetical protein
MRGCQQVVGTRQRFLADIIATPPVRPPEPLFDSRYPPASARKRPDPARRPPDHGVHIRVGSTTGKRRQQEAAPVTGHVNGHPGPGANVRVHAGSVSRGDLRRGIHHGAGPGVACLLANRRLPGPDGEEGGERRRKGLDESSMGFNKSQYRIPYNVDPNGGGVFDKRDRIGGDS